MYVTSTLILFLSTNISQEYNNVNKFCAQMYTNVHKSYLLYPTHVCTPTNITKALPSDLPTPVHFAQLCFVPVVGGRELPVYNP